MVQPRNTSEAGFQNVRCRGQGCGAVGKAMLEGYCNKCYVKEQSTRFNEAASRGSTSPPVLVSYSSLCHCLLTVLIEFFVLLTCVFTYLSFAISECPNHVQWRHSARPIADAAAVRMYHLAARTCARTAWIVEGSVRDVVPTRQKRRASSVAGHKAAIIMPTRKNKATAMSVTTSSRYTGADATTFLFPKRGLESLHTYVCESSPTRISHS